MSEISLREYRCGCCFKRSDKVKNKRGISRVF